MADFNARDEEGETISWSLGGADAGDFNIDGSTGELSFARRPNYEMPAGFPATPGDEPDNTYEIIVKATDASPSPNTRDFDVTVTVTDIDETPDITDPPADNLNYPETPYDSDVTPAVVATFSARDEEMQDITWSLGGADGGVFVITKDVDTGNGVVTFTTANPPEYKRPDYERPEDDESLNTYKFTVEASDGGNTGTWDYSVTVTDINETPELTGTPTTTVQYDENDTVEVASYTARDEEGEVTWSLTGADSSQFTIGSNGVVTFTEPPSWEEATDANEDNVYNFTVFATDVESGSPRLTTDSVDVTVTVADLEEEGVLAVDNLEPMVGGDCTPNQLNIPESKNCVVFTLTDPDGGILLDDGEHHWELHQRDPPPSESERPGEWERIPDHYFPFDPTSYYAPNLRELGKELRAVITYIDRRGRGKMAESPATKAVTAELLDNLGPRFVETTDYFIEEGPAGRLVSKALMGWDRDGDTLTFGIVEGELDADLLEVNPTTGELTVLPELDYETGKQVLHFSATLHDGKGLDTDQNVIDDDTLDVTMEFKLTVRNVDEEGMVTLSNPAPGVGVDLLATLVDGDGGIRGEDWEWQRSSNGSTNWFHISGETSRSHTTVQADEDFYLRAIVSYRDAYNRNTKTAAAVTSQQVYGDNGLPLFPSAETGQRAVSENTRAGANIGVPVAAVDPDNDTLTYSLSGMDANSFTIVAGSGQLRTSEALDFETKDIYRVTVKVHDGRDSSGNASTDTDDTQTVTIDVENVEEPGEVTLTTATQSIQARVPVMAELSDDDDPIDIGWQWSRSPDGRTGWVNISGTESYMYTPTLESDAGNYIRATASYTDGHGPDKSAEKVSPRVGDAPPVNSKPAFPATENGQRAVPENTVKDNPIGDPVAAADLNAGDDTVNDPLAYSLTGTDAASFIIDPGTGQLSITVALTFDRIGP